MNNYFARLIDQTSFRSSFLNQILSQQNLNFNFLFASIPSTKYKVSIIRPGRSSLIEFEKEIVLVVK